MPSSISRLHMTEAPTSRLLVKKVEPDYPDDAKVAGVEGDVVFRIIIGTDGKVQEIHLRRGKPLLIKAAAKAVSKWQYRPYMFNGHAVEVETFATVRFRLRANTCDLPRTRSKVLAAGPAQVHSRHD